MINQPEGFCPMAFEMIKTKGNGIAGRHLEAMYTQHTYISTGWNQRVSIILFVDVSHRLKILLSACFSVLPISKSVGLPQTDKMKGQRSLWFSLSFASFQSLEMIVFTVLAADRRRRCARTARRLNGRYWGHLQVSGRRPSFLRGRIAH